MIEPMLINEISNALNAYKQAITRTSDMQEKDDYSRLASITEKVITAMESGDVEQIKLGVLGFSRQVSDSFSTQPPEFKALAQRIAEVKKAI